MKKWYKNPWYIISIIIFLGLAGIIRTFQTNQQLANTYVAMGTLLLALATGFLAYFTWQSVKSSYDREKRERKDRLLNEIIEWAEDVAVYNLDLDKTILAERSGESAFMIVSHTQLLANLQKMWEKSKYITEIAKINYEAHRIVEDTKNKLKAIIDLLNSAIIHLNIDPSLTLDDALGRSSKPNTIDGLDNLRQELINSINKTIEKTAEIISSL